MKKNNKMLVVLGGTFIFLNLLIFCPLDQAAYAQEDYPNKMVYSVIPYPPGGATDLSCRALAGLASKYFGHPWVSIQKVGSMGVVAAIYTAQEKPDGYTIAHLAGPPFCTVPYMFDVAFDPSSLRPVIGWTQYPFFIAVRSDSPWKTVDDFVNYARSNPGIKYSHSGPGAFPHLAMESFAKAAKIKITGVPFKGDSDQATAILGKHVDVSCVTSGLKPLVDAGRIRILGMFTEKRVKGYDAPTMKEQGYELGLYSPFLGAFVHKDTPESIVKKIHDLIKKAIEDKAFGRSMDRLSMPIAYMSTQDFEVRLAKEKETCRVLIKELGLSKK